MIFEMPWWGLSRGGRGIRRDVSYAERSYHNLAAMLLAVKV